MWKRTAIAAQTMIRMVINYLFYFKYFLSLIEEFKFKISVSIADTSSERSPSSPSFLNADATMTIVRNQSTSPNMPDANVVVVLDDSTQYTKPNDAPVEIIECVSINGSNCQIKRQMTNAKII